MGDRGLRDLLDEWDGFTADAAVSLDVDLFGASLHGARADVQGLTLEASVSLLSAASSRAPAESGREGCARGINRRRRHFATAPLRVLRLPTASTDPENTHIETPESIQRFMETR